jgi:beta-lactamase regulating signal transducer with metallopeptidase domain
MNILYYLLEANGYLLILFAGYRVILSKSNFHQLSRAYLLLGTLFSFTLPFFNFSAGHVLVAHAPLVNAGNTVLNAGNTAAPFSFAAMLTGIYITGIVVMLILFLQKLLLIRKLSREGKREQYEEVSLIFLEKEIQPFSFFRLIFLPEKIHHEKDAIVVEHEVIHSREKHSIDIILLETFKIISWCIPLVHLVQKQLKLVHEYIVDARITGQHAELDNYINHILRYSSSGNYQALGSNMNYKALLKNRIVMMYTTPQKPVKKLKYLLPLLLLAPAVYASSVLFSKNYGFNIFNDGVNAADTTIKKEKKKASKDEHYYPVIIDTSKADTVIGKDGQVMVIQDLITDTAHEVHHP